MKFNRCLPILTLLAMSIASAQAADEVLRYKAVTDRELVYQSSNKVNQLQKVAGMEVATKIATSEFSVRRFPSEPKDGVIQMESENKKLTVEMTVGPLGDYKFDSSELTHETGSALGGALTPLYESLTGLIVRVEMTDRGKIEKVSGFEDLLAGVLENNPIARQFAAGASPEGARATYSELYVEFPEKAISQGASWEVPYSIKLPQIGDVQGKRKYKFVGEGEYLGRRTIKISLTSEMNLDVNLDTGNGVTVSGTLGVTDSSGEIQFDPELGQLVVFTSKATVKGDLTVNANGNTIPLTQEQTQETSMRLLEKLPE